MEKNGNLVSIAGFAAGRGQRLWHFDYPHQLVQDPTLRLEQKRAILAAWASDAHAVESFPVLRHLPGTPYAVTFASIMDARKALDRLSSLDDDDDDDDEDPPPRPAAARLPLRAA